MLSEEKSKLELAQKNNNNNEQSKKNNFNNNINEIQFL